jgi:Protein of unknown function (DUF4242)
LRPRRYAALYGFFPMPSLPTAPTMARPRTETPRQAARSTGGKGDSVAVFVVDRTLPGMSLEHLAAAHRALAESSRRLSSGDDHVRYLRSTFAPARARCLCVFEATSGDLVRRVNDVAQVPFVSIDEAIEFQAPGSGMP